MANDELPTASAGATCQQRGSWVPGSLGLATRGVKNSRGQPNLNAARPASAGACPEATQTGDRGSEGAVGLQGFERLGAILPFWGSG